MPNILIEDSVHLSGQTQGLGTIQTTQTKDRNRCMPVWQMAKGTVRHENDGNIDIWTISAQDPTSSSATPDTFRQLYNRILSQPPASVSFSPKSYI
ncbi:hypothetical protein AB1N83_013765 [Pleurotus pulmonarius]